MKNSIIPGCATIVGALFFLCACDKAVDVSQLDPSTQVILVHKKDSTQFSGNQIVWMAAEDEYLKDFSKRSIIVKSTVAEDDLIIFTDYSNARSNIGTIMKAYQNGAVVIFVKPKFEEVTELMAEQGLSHMYPTEGEYLFYGISRRGSYSFRKPLKCSPEVISESVPDAKAEYSYSESDLVGDDIDPYSNYNSDEPAMFIGPLVEWTNGVVLPYTKGSSITDDVCEYKETFSWDCDLFVHKCALSSQDRIKGIFQAGFIHKYKPLFSQNAGDGTVYGDFYQFSTDYTADPSGVWKGDDFVHKHGGVRVHIKGAFIRDITYKTYISGDGSNPYFYCQPQPNTDNNKVQYSDTQGFNIGGGVSGGIVNKGPTVTGSFQWGYNESSTVSKTVSDVSVVNYSKINDSDYIYSGKKTGPVGSSVSWQFVFGNLPGPKGEGFSGKCPASAHSYQSFPTQWVWSSKSQPSGSAKSIGDVVTVITPVLGGCHNGRCVDGSKNTWEIGAQRSHNAMVVPNRIVFGTMSIVNDLGENYKIHDFVIKKHDDQTTVYSNSTDLLYLDGLEISLAINTYDISAKVWDSATKTESEYVLARPYSLVQRISKTDIKTISFERNFVKK